jgi:hypothetical protein
MPGLLAFLTLLLAPGFVQAAEPRVAAIETSGVVAYDRSDVERILRLAPGSALRRSPEELAATLQARYRIDGFPAARVAGRFEAETGTLRLEVDEGRLAEIVAEGLSPGAARRAVAASGLELGRVLRDADAYLAFDRLENVSQGALKRGDYRVESLAEGARLALLPQTPAAALEPSLGAFAGAGRHNRVDGWTQPLGATLTLFDHGHYNHTRLMARGAYASGAEDWRWQTVLARGFFAGDRLVLGYERHDVTDSDDVWRGAGLDEAPGEAIWNESFSRYYARNGHQAFAFLRLGRRLHLGISYRSDRYASLPVVTDADEANPAVAPGAMRSLIGTLRLERGEALFDELGLERDSFLLPSLFGTQSSPPRSLRLELSLEVADASRLGGDFTFSRFVGILRGRHLLGTRQRLDGRVLLGLGDDRLPPQKRFALGGVGTLRGFPYATFSGERLFLVTGEYGYELGGRFPRVLAFYDGGSVASGGAQGEGFKSSIGVGLRWPASGAAHVRLERAHALDRDLAKSSRTLFRVQIPF